MYPMAEWRRVPRKHFDPSGKSPAHLHRRKNQARAGKFAAGFLNQTIRCQAITLPGAPKLATWLTAKADFADRRAPGEHGGQAEPEAMLPRHCASLLQALKPNPALSTRARSHHRPLRRRPETL
jgi:hypothetical protein